MSQIKISQFITGRKEYYKALKQAINKCRLETCCEAHKKCSCITVYKRVFKERGKLNIDEFHIKTFNMNKRCLLNNKNKTTVKIQIYYEGKIKKLKSRPGTIPIWKPKYPVNKYTRYINKFRSCGDEFYLYDIIKNFDTL